MELTDYADAVQYHYERFWNSPAAKTQMTKGRVNDLPSPFRVLEFRPRDDRDLWTYATCCMSLPGDPEGIELHLFSPVQDSSNAELLTAIAHYHRTERFLSLGHTVNFGRPWFPGSACDHGLISLPYLDGPELEYEDVNGGRLRFLWLIPITRSEREFKKARGLEALEEIFEKRSFNYAEPLRASVI